LYEYDKNLASFVVLPLPLAILVSQNPLESSAKSSSPFADTANPASTVIKDFHKMSLEITRGKEREVGKHL
jgi:hypothetical protein